ncbi:hypothetical protein AC249_AIPGENE19047 [Exaiptasia diaphana]|nr:hypothetical protein AC249_AIPGENE19047 [Exaiptasia diaphana]
MGWVRRRYQSPKMEIQPKYEAILGTFPALEEGGGIADLNHDVFGLQSTFKALAVSFPSIPKKACKETVLMQA